jgi:hypothetical protein
VSGPGDELDVVPLVPLRDDTAHHPLDAGEQVALGREVDVDEGPVAHHPHPHLGIAVAHGEGRDRVEEPHCCVLGILQGQGTPDRAHQPGPWEGPGEADDEQPGRGVVLASDDVDQVDEEVDASGVRVRTSRRCLDQDASDRVEPLEENRLGAADSGEAHARLPFFTAARRRPVTPPSAC